MVAVTVAGISRRLPVIEVAPGIRIAAFVMLGDVELVAACARELAAKLRGRLGSGAGEVVLVAPEAKAVPLVHGMASELGHARCVVCRKSLKTYMVGGIEVPVASITTPGAQKLVISGSDAAWLAGRDVVLVDDVVSTGGTLRAMETLMVLCGARVVARAAAMLEGEADETFPGVLALGQLPVWRG